MHKKPRVFAETKCSWCGKTFMRSGPRSKQCSIKCRFLSKIDKQPGHGPEGECWMWLGAKTRGYGEININGKPERANRIAHELFIGPVPTDMVVRHSCHLPSCVNPGHLRLGSQADNMRDMVLARRQLRGEARSRILSGERSPLAKLTENDVQWIRWLYKQGHTTHRKLARAFHVSHGNIAFILRGGTWKYS